MEDSRFLRLWTRFEDFRLKLAEMLVNVMVSDPDRDHKTAWSSGGRARTETIKWSDIKALQKDMFSWSLDALPMSAASAAVRRDALANAAAEGLVGPDEMRTLTSPPDLERIEDLEMASVRDIWRHLELLEDGILEPPDEVTNLTYGLPKVVYNLLDLRSYDDVPAEVLDAHLEWIQMARSIQTMAVDPTQQAPGPGPAMGIAGTEMPNNSQGFPGQPFEGPGGPMDMGLPPGVAAPVAPPMPPMPGGMPPIV